MGTVKSIYSVIAVPDFGVSVPFYRDVLGFEVNELGDPGWRLYEYGSFKILAGECPDATPASEIGDHSYFAYLVIDDIDEHYKRLGAAGVEIVKTIRDEPWANREFGIRTIDGHRIMFAQPVDLVL
jgi:catechol 2,3-dioxygenase-like lactoylglutathione lyase family enzyme